MTASPHFLNDNNNIIIKEDNGSMNERFKNLLVYINHLHPSSTVSILPVTEMIALKATQTSFTTNNYVLFHTKRLPKRRSTLSLCKSNDNDSSPSDGSSSEGDSRKQDLLARLAMLQAQKVRLTDYLDERSAYLTQFAEETNAEFDQIGENALKELEEAGARVCFPLLYIHPNA